MKSNQTPTFSVGQKVSWLGHGLPCIISRIRFIDNVIRYDIVDSFSKKWCSVRERELELCLDKFDDLPPMQDDCPDLESLRSELSEYIKYIAENPATNVDMEHYIYESVMTAFYGNEVWAWINDQVR